ncbi:hypothetical protein Sd1_gp12 [Shigella phage Sd1]|uniref:Uncharacterized protein n=1 Tax=Shigella phage Sd1 TaxID=2024313 RepID=A0A291AYL6_9CAUD|nr:hypothetical protein HOR98_gp11 [Shigella phage Sd1]ATE86078.1 hypothetical protein Sd1_gp12 [Shigella phage Sd1]
MAAITIFTGKIYESRKTGYQYELVISDSGYSLDDNDGYAFEVSPTYKDDLETVKNAFGEKFDEVSE